MENTVDWCQVIEQKLIFNKHPWEFILTKVTVTVSAKIKVPRQVSASLTLMLGNICFFSYFAFSKAEKYKVELKVRNYLLWNQV